MRRRPPPILAAPDGDDVPSHAQPQFHPMTIATVGIPNFAQLRRLLSPSLVQRWWPVSAPQDIDANAALGGG